MKPSSKEPRRKEAAPKTEEEKALEETLAAKVDEVNQAFLDGSELTREMVDVLVKADKIRETDSDKDAGLQLFCNTRGNPSEAGLERECRGVVFKGDTLILKAFPYPIETDTTQNETLTSAIEPMMDKCMFFDSHEGALVRMFNHEGKWYTCTHRKLDAYKSKWASQRSFGDSFVDGLEAEMAVNDALRESVPEGDEPLLERFQTLLDEKKQYMFLIRHSNENRIVCAAPERPTVYHVGTFVGGELVMTECVNVPYPRQRQFATLEELTKAVEEIDPCQLQGVIVFAPGNVQYKVQNTFYRDYFQIRGNEPSVPFQYLRLRTKRDDRELLEYLYPDMVKVFQRYENCLYEIAQRVFDVYRRRFIQGETMAHRPVQEFRILSACHSWHKSDPSRNKVGLSKVIEVMNTQPAPALNFLIKQLEQERKELLKVQAEEQTKARSSTITSDGSPMLRAAQPKNVTAVNEDVPDLGDTVVTNEKNEERVLSEVTA